MAGEPKQFEQHYRRIAIATPVGDHVLNLTHIDGTEELSRLFAYDLKMVSEKEDIKPEEIVGKNVTVTIMDVDDTPRYLNGYVRQFINRGIGDRGTVYTAEMVPWFWFLTRRTNCRIFQELTVPQIIEEIFQELGFSDFDLSGLSGSFDKRVYCVQYRETDFDFISRWMEHEGIFYYFRHEADRHVLCLCSAAGAYQPAKDKEVTVGSTSIDIVDENVFTWEHRYEFRSGKVAHADFDFEKPQQPVEGKEKTLMKTRESASFELYDYPGDFVDKGRGQALARLRMEEEETPHDVVYGTGCCRSFNPGFKFKVGRHAQKHEVGREYVITTVRHVASSGDYVTGGSDANVYPPMSTQLEQQGIELIQGYDPV
ncbi:MAG: type VI secretion system tip protein TssI/VgrG, partial [Thermomicrobiales bacterium]